MKAKRWIMGAKFLKDNGLYTEVVLASDYDKLMELYEHSETKVKWLLRDNELNTAKVLKEREAKLLAALRFISNGCLVPPDGGSPGPDDAVNAAREAIAEHEKGGT